MSLPYIEPEDDIYLNLSIVLIVIQTLGVTKKGTLKINNERLHIFLYLLKNPVKLNNVLGSLGKSSLILSERETFSITSISPNVDPLFDRSALKSLLSILVANNLVVVEFKSKYGFFYKLSEKGQAAVKEFRDEYLLEVRLLCEKLKSVLSLSESKLNQALNQIIRKESA
jgi:hypothetical protein